jgi:hypothetical protein
MAMVTPDWSDAPTDLIEPDSLSEVIDGKVVEKAVGANECWLPAVMFGALAPYQKANPLGRAVQEMIFDLQGLGSRARPGG